MIKSIDTPKKKKTEKEIKTAMLHTVDLLLDLLPFKICWTEVSLLENSLTL